MAQYPIKMLKDENGTPFVPLVAPEAVKDTQGTNWQTLIDKKLEKTNIIAGDNITLSVSGNDITINSQAGGASDYTALSNKPSLDTTSNKALNPLKEEINGEIALNKIAKTGNFSDLLNKPKLNTNNNTSLSINSAEEIKDIIKLHKIAKTGNYEDLLYKPIIPITFTDNMESDYSISKLPGWQVDLLQKMIDEYVKDNKSINNYILKADGIMFLENYAIGNLDNKYSTEGKNTRLYTFKKCGPYGSIPHAFQFVGPTSLSYTKYPEWGYGVISISNKGILIYCDNNYRVTEVCQRYKLYDEAEKNTSVSIEVVPTNLSRATAFIATKDHQPATKKYVDDSINGIVESGSNTNGSWTKWADGTMIINKTVLGTANITNAWGSLYISNDINLGDFPVAFIEKPTVVVSPQTQTGTQYMLTGQGTSGYGTETNAGNVALVRPNSRTGVDYRLEVMAKGKWK